MPRRAELTTDVSLVFQAKKNKLLEKLDSPQSEDFHISAISTYVHEQWHQQRSSHLTKLARHSRAH